MYFTFMYERNIPKAIEYRTYYIPLAKYYFCGKIPKSRRGSTEQRQQSEEEVAIAVVLAAAAAALVFS